MSDNSECHVPTMINSVALKEKSRQGSDVFADDTTIDGSHHFYQFLVAHFVPIHQTTHGSPEVPCLNKVAVTRTLLSPSLAAFVEIEILTMLVICDCSPGSIVV